MVSGETGETLASRIDIKPLVFYVFKGKTVFYLCWYHITTNSIPQLKTYCLSMWSQLSFHTSPELSLVNGDNWKDKWKVICMYWLIHHNQPVVHRLIKLPHWSHVFMYIRVSRWVHTYTDKYILRKLVLNLYLV